MKTCRELVGHSQIFQLPPVFDLNQTRQISIRQHRIRTNLDSEVKVTICGCKKSWEEIGGSHRVEKGKSGGIEESAHTMRNYHTLIVKLLFPFLFITTTTKAVQYIHLHTHSVRISDRQA